MTYYKLNENNGKMPPLGGRSALFDASVEELRVLLCVLEAGAVATDDLSVLARAAGCSLPRARAALRYWCECGLLAESENADTAPENVNKGVPVCSENGENAAADANPAGANPTDCAPVGRGLAPAAPQFTSPAAPSSSAPDTKKPLRPAQEVGEASAATVAKTVKDENLAAFIDTAQQTVGRVFNLRELNILTGLFDTTPFSAEYLLILISYCKTKTKRFSFSYLEKTAYSMLERECLSTDALNEYLSLLERVSTREWRLRRLFGFGERRLSPRERGYFERWLGEFDYDTDIIGIAYDITVNNTGKLSLPYMDKLLTRFSESGCRDVAAVEALLEKERDEKKGKTALRHTGAAKRGRDTTYRTDLDESGSATSGSSFVASDFLAAALRRSYGDDGEDKE